MKPTGKWRVQVGKDKSAYKDRYVFHPDERNRAIFYFNSLNTHSGYKKRLVNPRGKIIGRVLT